MGNGTHGLVRGFGLLQATALNMSNMVGIGPFITIPAILASMGGPQCMLGWILGTLLALCDGLVWSELAAAMPGTGGTYLYLREAFTKTRLGLLFPFLFVWQFIFSGPLEIASGFIGFAQYVGFFWRSMGVLEAKLLAVAVGALVLAMLYRGITAVGRLTVVLWAGMLVTVTWIIGSGLANFNPALAFDYPANAFTFSTGFFLGLGGAMLIAMYCFLGYYDICYVGGEVREPERVMPRAIIYSVLAVAAIYSLMTLCIIAVVPWREAMASKFIVAEFMQRLYGNWAGGVVTVLILWSALASVFALTLGYSRIPYAAALDGNFFRAFGRLHPKGNFPHLSLVVIGGLSMAASLLTLETVLKALLTARILIQFIGQIAALDFIRRRRPQIRRPFRMWLYPLPSLIALVGWSYVFLTSGWRFIVFGILILVSGIAAHRLWQKSAARLVSLGLLAASISPMLAQRIVTVRPKEIDDVLVNPGIGFMTFQRFNGDELNVGLKWTEGYPIVYQEFKGSLENKDHPMTSIAYFRVYWKFIEPEQGKYAWALLDTALKTAHSRGQTLMLRIAPYGTTKDNDVPDWYRALVGPEPKLPVQKWRTDPEDPRYALHFGKMVRALGRRYDGHPDMESVDLSIVGAWGEGAGSADLTEKTREALVDAYLESFRKTPLVMLLTDEKTNKYGISQRPVGWRVDCLGDMGGFNPNWNHMLDYYPQGIVDFGMQDAWKKAPVTFEVCWVMQHWKNQGWDIDYIIDQSLKWHISSFNAKSSAVPKEWWPQVNRWLKRMGYRFVLRKFTYPATVRPHGKLEFTSWWENKGVAPCYRQFPLALRLKSAARADVLVTDADIRAWLPGDNLYDDAVSLPFDMPAGEYELGIALLDPVTHKPKVKLAIAGVDGDGWYNLGKLSVQ